MPDFSTSNNFSDVENDPNFAACENQALDEYYACLGECVPPGPECLSNCNRIYDENFNNCPCQQNCPDGCPCPNFECTDPRAVLVLNSYYGPNVPVLIDAEGRFDTNLVTQFGEETQVHGSCSVTYRNKFYIFGGQFQKRQIIFSVREI